MHFCGVFFISMHALGHGVTAVLGYVTLRGGCCDVLLVISMGVWRALLALYCIGLVVGRWSLVVGCIFMVQKVRRDTEIKGRLACLLACFAYIHTYVRCFMKK
jgi:hypothetical protein